MTLTPQDAVRRLEQIERQARIWKRLLPSEAEELKAIDAILARSWLDRLLEERLLERLADEG